MSRRRLSAMSSAVNITQRIIPARPLLHRQVVEVIPRCRRNRGGNTPARQVVKPLSELASRMAAVSLPSPLYSGERGESERGSRACVGDSVACCFSSPFQRGDRAVTLPRKELVARVDVCCFRENQPCRRLVAPCFSSAWLHRLHFTPNLVIHPHPPTGRLPSMPTAIHCRRWLAPGWGRCGSARGAGSIGCVSPQTGKQC